MRKFLSLCLISLCGVLPLLAQSSAVDIFVSDPALRPASVGIYVADVATGEVIASANEWQSHIPASTVKVITTATALRLLGSSFTPMTQVDCMGEVDADGVLQGDIVVRGGGDPTLGSAYGNRCPDDFVCSVVRALQAKGIRKIAGRIRVDNSLFEGYSLSPKTMIEDVTWDYGSGCHALNYRDNRLVVKLQSEGEQFRVSELSPAGVWEVVVDLVKGDKEDITVVREDGCWRVSGTIPRKRDQYTLALAVDRPEVMLVSELTRQLSQVGITVVEGDFAIATPSALLLNYPGESLGEVVRSLNFRSDNLYAESVLRLLPPEGNEPRGAEAGLNTIRRYWHRCGVDSLALFQYDGSGLARNNKISAEYIGKVLRLMAQDSVFVHSLPVVGKEGSVAYFMRRHKLPGELRLKSGSMSDVQAYAGYYTTASNRYVVVVMVNNYTCSRATLRRKIATLLTRIWSEE